MLSSQAHIMTAPQLSHRYFRISSNSLRQRTFECGHVLNGELARVCKIAHNVMLGVVIDASFDDLTVARYWRRHELRVMLFETISDAGRVLNRNGRAVDEYLRQLAFVVCQQAFRAKVYLQVPTLRHHCEYNVDI